MKHTFFFLLLAIVTLASCTEWKEKRELKRIEDARVADSIKTANRIADSLEVVKQIEKQKADSIALEKEKAEKIKAIKNTVSISYYLSEPNSAGGVDAHFSYKNLSNKTIKYLCWTGYPINAVGDMVSSEIGGESIFTGKDTGPVRPGQYCSGGYWECAWYCYQAEKLVLTGIDIEYMDGSTFSISEEELQYVKGYKNYKHS